MKSGLFGIIGLMVALGLSGCRDSGPVYHGEESPLRLSDWNLLSIGNDNLSANQASLRFKPANTLFTDYAHKFRTLWVPDEAEISMVDGKFHYPVGTMLSKTFYYPKTRDGRFVQSHDTGNLDVIALSEYRLLETRLLVKRETQWTAFPYVWNDEQNEAFLRVAGASVRSTIENGDENFDFTYFVPNENQCAGCHMRVGCW